MNQTVSYGDFVEAKRHRDTNDGFAPVFVPDFLFDFQKSLLDWSIRKGRGALFADTGLGKTPMQLVWGENVMRHTNKPVLILTPLAVSMQTVKEAEKFGIDAKRGVTGKTSSNITVSNYERLHYFDPSDFSGVVCDESSILKNFSGARRKEISGFLRKIPYRLLCTATAAPNDYYELGTSSEALGYLGYMEMLATFFKSTQDDTLSATKNKYNPLWWESKFRLKQHAEHDFWRWICSWARACRRPSDVGDFSDERFELPPLKIQETIIENTQALDGELFVLIARSMKEQRAERRVTIKERCEMVAEKCSHHDSSVIWAHLNDEADLCEQIVEGAVQVSGSMSDEEKEEKLIAFSSGEIKRIVTKPKIASMGMNWQHCAHQTFFPSHSFEQFYQGVRRCWRFGQTREVTVDIITTNGEARVMANLERKSKAAEKMFKQLVDNMNAEIKIERYKPSHDTLSLPSWI